MKRTLYIDFEGNLKKGIREVGYLLLEDGKIISSIEKSDEEAIKALFEIEKLNIDYIFAHNATIEKNLIKKYIPYKINKLNGKINSFKWVDSLDVYRKLYPQLEKYDLKSLVKIFIDRIKLKELSESLCKKKRNSYHFPLFDCICVYLLIQRLESTVNFGHFHQD